MILRRTPLFALALRAARAVTALPAVVAHPAVVPLAAASALAVAGGPAVAGAQTQTACTILGCEQVQVEISPFAGQNSFSMQQVWGVVNDILGVSGLAPNFQVVETREVGNAAAMVIDDERYLAFNPDWMERYRDDPQAKWQLYGVMAHEVGHHLQGHTLTRAGSRPPTELEADEYAGFTLAALGASLPQAQSLWNTLPDEGSSTHPPRHQRLDAIERGWQRRMGDAGATQTASAGAAVNTGIRPATGQSAPQNAPLNSGQHSGDITTATGGRKVVQNQPPTPNPPRHTIRRHVSAGETCGSGWSGVARVQICASSYLGASGGNRYDPALLLDDDTATAWVEGVHGHGTGEYIAVDFPEPTRVRSLSFVNGYVKSKSTFLRNSRVRQVRVTLSTGESYVLDLDDTTTTQSFQLDRPETLNWVKIDLLGVYAGSHYTDTAISELWFNN